MRINTNVSSLTAQEAAQNTSKRITSSLEKLSTGLRINKASDDASGLAIADKLRTQATSINQGISNGNSAVSLLQIADKSMAEQSNILDTIKSKLIQANTDTTSADGRESIRKDIAKLLEQLDNIAEQTNYNGNVLLQQSATDKKASNSLSFQVGETSRDIITNAAIQSNTDGLGSKVSYGPSVTINGGSSKFVASTTGITIKNADSAGSGVAEKVTLDGDVDSLTLAVGTKVSNVDTATKAKLDALVTANKATVASGTYSITTASTLDLSAIDNVKATLETVTPSTVAGATPTNISVTQGEVISNVSNLVTGSALEKALNDTNLFTKLATGMYVAIATGGATIGKLTGTESFKLNNTVEVVSEASGSTASKYSPGDTIKATIVSGSLLDKSLNDTSMFTKVSTGVYKVKEDYTAGKLYLMGGESISITNGNTVSLAKTSSVGLTLTGMKYNPGGVTANGTAAYRTSNTGTQLRTSGTQGPILYAAGEDTLSFTISGTSTGATGVFGVKAGDIITLVKDQNDTSGSEDNLSLDLLEGTNFIDLGSGKYQAKADTNLDIDKGDTIKVTRLIGGLSTPSVVAGPAAGAQNVANNVNDTVSLYQNTSATAVADTDIKLTIGNGATITNNDNTAGNKLTVSSAADLTNGKNNLAELAALGDGDLTAKLASDFQSVIDDAITKLNGYRGDIGSTQNQVESAVRNLMTQATNVKAAESIIRDVDYAAESANFNKQNIISQAGSYAISQANSVQQNVLKLLQ